jgi:hypothetical protein
VFFLLLVLFLGGCTEEKGDYQYWGYIVKGEQGSAEPLKNIQVLLKNNYYNKTYAETYTNEAGLFMLYIKEADIQKLDEEDWSYDVRLYAVDESNVYYSATIKVAYPDYFKRKINCGVIFMKERKQ